MELCKHITPRAELWKRNFANILPLERSCGSGTSGRYISIAELQMVNCSNIDGLLAKRLMIIFTNAEPDQGPCASYVIPFHNSALGGNVIAKFCFRNSIFGGMCSCRSTNLKSFSCSLT